MKLLGFILVIPWHEPSQLHEYFVYKTENTIPAVKEWHSISFVHITMINFPTDIKKVF